MPEDQDVVNRIGVVPPGDEPLSHEGEGDLHLPDDAALVELYVAGVREGDTL